MVTLTRRAKDEPDGVVTWGEVDPDGARLDRRRGPVHPGLLDATWAALRVLDLDIVAAAVFR